MVGVLYHNRECEDLDDIKCPEFPDDMRIGQYIFKHTLNPNVTGLYNPCINHIPEIPGGDVTLSVHTHGIRIAYGWKKFYDIHHLQITDIHIVASPYTNHNTSAINTSSNGRVMGPLNALIDDMSAGNSIIRLYVTRVLVINFWDIITNTQHTLLIGCNENQPLEDFIARFNKNDKINRSTGRKAIDGISLYERLFWGGMIFTGIVIIFGFICALITLFL